MTTKKPVLTIGNRAYSSWSLRGWLAVEHVDLDVDIVRLPMDTPEFERRIGHHSPSRRVPALKLGDETIWDSLAIIETLAERFPAANLWPTDAADRAHARSVAAEMHASFTTLRTQLPFNCRASGRRVDIGAALAADIRRVVEIWQTCLARSAAPGPWLFGPFTGADAMYAPVASRFSTYGIELTDDAAAYVRTVLAAPAMRAWTVAAAAEPEIIEAEEVGVVD